MSIIFSGYNDNLILFTVHSVLKIMTRQYFFFHEQFVRLVFCGHIQGKTGLSKNPGFHMMHFGFPRPSAKPSCYLCPCVGPLLTPTLNLGWPGFVRQRTSRNNTAGLVFKRTGNFYLLLLGTLTFGSLELAFKTSGCLAEENMWRGHVNRRGLVTTWKGKETPQHPR